MLYMSSNKIVDKDYLARDDDDDDGNFKLKYYIFASIWSFVKFLSLFLYH